MVKLSVVQGRLSSEVAGKYQHFPIHNWRNEFYEAKKLGFDGIEWIVSDFSNPIFDPIIQKEIINLVNDSGVQIPSISLDLLMPKTLDRFSRDEFYWIFDNINLIAKKIKLKRVSIPVEETCGIRDPNTAMAVNNKLSEILNYNSKNTYLLAIETDMAPVALHSFLSDKSLKNLGVLMDLGNAAAYGYKIADYFDLLPEKIYSLHIKDRLLGIGPSVPLGEGSGEFNYLKSGIKGLTNLQDITLQTYRTSEKYLKDLELAKEFIHRLLFTN